MSNVEAKGTVDTHNTGNSWTAIFNVDGHKYSFSASMSPNVTAFEITKAKVHYTVPEDLTGSGVDYAGTVGKEIDITLNSSSKVTITGNLDVGFEVYPETNITGTGTWSATTEIR
ncbi:uncharacterized protein PHACADRAFT_213046 [Phanerochaete carnosa HHB-10118-sp]|uniref:Uncharacterized protein n=1 Tax=Phanerochaete carnosa (strain HHB-10118-sp) TaxID=650164 RepID=K5WLJ2_PHACS|nr:uncharacterized protein PHACADRAFT_213046 [Phanerochaete carnosa HHB-10118-sp]EKM51162.1 hypothetical protein PHACADRAFT_213046 [Phanerochaete carnosa HHB-10118-sp]